MFLSSNNRARLDKDGFSTFNSGIRAVPQLKRSIYACAEQSDGRKGVPIVQITFRGGNLWKRLEISLGFLRVSEESS